MIHLEDILLEDGVDINPILWSIHNNVYPKSIKWDGSPAFVVGHDPHYFLAFKNGYHKKTPQKFYSVNELIDTIVDKNLLRKMIQIFESFYLLPISDGVIEGDFMFDAPMLESGHIFQPNTVQYHVNYKSNYVRYDLGVAIHTVNGQHVPNYTNANIAQHGTLFVGGEIIQKSGKPPLICVDKSDLPSNKAKFKKKINDSVRLGYFHMEQTKFFTEYMKVIEWKDFLLRSMWTNSNVVSVENHEGMVVDTGERLIKLVNRLDFSTKNFNRTR